MEFILFVIVALYIYKKFLNKKSDTNIKNSNNNTTIPSSSNNSNNNLINYKYYYKPKRYLITLTELNFYNVLLEIAKELNLILFSQVSLYNILEVKDKSNNIAFNKIRSKCIDFVLVDKSDCRIRICIELDDYTHNRKDRKERNVFINNLFSSLEIPLIRFRVSNYYNKDALKKRIQESIPENCYNK